MPGLGSCGEGGMVRRRRVAVERVRREKNAGREGYILGGCCGEMVILRGRCR